MMSLMIYFVKTEASSTLSAEKSSHNKKRASIGD